MKVNVCIMVFVFLSPVLLFSYEPSLQLSTGLSGGLGRLEGGPWDTSAAWDGGGLFFWRNRLGEKSFFTLAYQLSGSLDLETKAADDSQYLMVQGRFPLAGGSLLLSQETQASLIAEGDFNTRDFYPSWEARYDFGGPAKAPVPFAVYRGRFDLPQDDQERFLENSGSAGIVWNPSFRQSHEVQAGYGFSRYLTNQTSLPDGSDSGTPRTDHLLTLKAATSGLIGFYGEYEGTLEGSLRLSNENRVVNGVPEEGSEDRLSLGASGSLRWAPRQSFNTSLGINMQEDLYLSRRALTDLGGLSEENLSLFLAEAILETQWKVNDRWNLFGELRGSKSFSNEAVYTGENLSLSFWVELSLDFPFSSGS